MDGNAVMERIFDHAARLSALEEWQRRQNGHLAEIERKVTSLQTAVLGLHDKITDIHKQNNGILLALALALLGLIANFVMLFVRG